MTLNKYKVIKKKKNREKHALIMQKRKHACSNISVNLIKKKRRVYIMC